MRPMRAMRYMASMTYVSLVVQMTILNDVCDFSKEPVLLSTGNDGTLVSHFDRLKFRPNEEKAKRHQ